MNRFDGTSLRKFTYFAISDLRGLPLGHFYDRYSKDYLRGIPPDTIRKHLTALLSHAKKNVPYYAKIMEGMGDGYLSDPFGYLKEFPILTKRIIRNEFDKLISADIDKRKWFYNTSGGSTGEPVRFIQDYEYIAKSGAIKLVFSRFIGREIGQSEYFLWGSERDINHGSENFSTRMINKLTNSTFINSFRMTPERMHDFIRDLNTKRPQLITAYAESLYEVARFVERNGLEVRPQKAIITSAGTLFPFMREKIADVFQCPVYNRYGSREVGDVACELPGKAGVWVAPWGNYLEVVDGEQNHLPSGKEGEIIVTSLINYAMPLLRYQIGDCGILDEASGDSDNRNQQVLSKVIGRVSGIFKLKNGTLLDPGYLEFLMYFKDWIEKFQIVQKGHSSILFKFVCRDSEDHSRDLEEFSEKTKLLMGKDCEVTFQFMDEILPSPSGKFQYTISEV